MAVDNVLERLGDPTRPFAKWINALRIGDESKAGDAVKQYLPDKRKSTDRERFSEFLRSQPETPARLHLREAISDDGLMTRLVLETSNVVCGTTIGILRLRQLLGDGNSRGPRATDLSDLFDMLIIDEASKTTFQEFLVPALLAKRWVLVGDPRQLSPYVDEDLMKVGLEAALPEAQARDACFDVFQARPDTHSSTRRRLTSTPRQRPVLVVTDNEGVRDDYREQAEARGVAVANLESDDPFELAGAGVLLAAPEVVAERQDVLPPDLCRVRVRPDAEARIDLAVLDDIRRRAAAWLRIVGARRKEDDDWAGQYAYRLVREHEQRFRVGGQMAMIDEDGNPDPQDTPTKREKLLRDEQVALRPVFLDDDGAITLADGIDRVRRATLPSILESLQSGFATSARRTRPNALVMGLPPARFYERHVLLEYQHRMHPDIAAFPRDRVYGGRALATDNSMRERRSWGFEPGKPRARWLHVGGTCSGRSSPREADVVMEQVGRFVTWAKANPHHDERGVVDGKPWEVAVLAFYRAQERLLRDLLRDRSGQQYANHLFRAGPEDHPACTIRLCTVDRFQGQEADLVIISIANDHTTTFLESLNRLNVAITRARYSLLIVGNKQAMGQRRSQGSLIHELAHSKSISFEGDLKERPSGTHDRA